MFKAFDNPIKIHIADAYNSYEKPIVYDADTIDTETDIFKALYLIYGTADTETDINTELLKSLGCKNPQLYNPKKGTELMIGGTWLG